MEHCKKLSSWDIYGVRKFPYRGKRKYSPGVNRSFYGTITVTNDVFGLTIWQFEREFMGLLARRKQNEQRILNIRFPDKTTSNYIEYLEYGDQTVEGCKPIADPTLYEELRSYRNLIKVAGTELEIRTRQRMFTVLDKIKNRLVDFKTEVFHSSGSLAEGIDLTGSDIDIMYESKEVTVIDDLKYLNTSLEQTTLLMEHDVRYPGFCKLKLVAEGYRSVNRCIVDSFKDEHSGVYLSTESFLHYRIDDDKSRIRHGPCISDKELVTDIAYCLGSKFWPTNAMNWICRHRTGQWPTENLIDTVVNDGCLFVPIGPKNECNELLWRISFSLAEKRLTHSMNYTQLLCYILLKLTLKNIINKDDDVKDLLCSYFLKTTVFWLSEEICIDTFKITNLSYCFSLCTDKLILFVRNCYCPNYFIPQHNMFIGKVDESNNKLLLSILSELRNTELQSIIEHTFGNNFSYHSVSSMANEKKLFVNLDILFYRVLTHKHIGDKSRNRGYKTLQYIELLMESESSEFILGVLRYYRAAINQGMSQLLHLPDRRYKCGCSCCRNDNLIRRCNKHLMEGTKSDAASGWLLYASFYYVLGQYKNTLQIVDNVLSRCTPDMIKLHADYSTEEIEKYKHKTKSHLTLNHKMRQATFDYVFYAQKSTLIPQELQLEVQDDYLEVPPILMCHCLQFLCYHHLGDVNKKHRALRKFHLTINEENTTELSNFLVLGVCYETLGNRDAAYHCYKTTDRNKHVSPRAQRRIENLFHAWNFDEKNRNGVIFG